MRLFTYLRGLTRRRAIEAETDDELRFHVEMETAANRARGLPADEARRVAMRDLGGVTQTTEAVRAVRTLWLDTLWQDVRHATRMLRRSPAFAAMAILVLALGIGVNTAVFSIINAVFFRPLPVPAPEELIYIYDQSALIDIGEFRQRFDAALRGVTAHTSMRRVFSVDGQDSERTGEIVTANYFDVVGIKPMLGRTFRLAEDELATTELAVVISYDVWTREFRRDPEAVGKVVRIDNRRFTVVGVVGPAFQGLSEPWNPTRYWVTAAQFYEVSSANVAAALVRHPGSDLIARLRPGVSLASVRGIEPPPASSARDPGPHRYLILPAADVLVPSRPTEKAWPIRLAAYATTVVVVMVLIIAAVNIAGVLLARGVTRAPELAVRRALGAGTSRLVRQLLTESVLLASAGGGVGLFLAWLLVAVYRLYSPSQYLVDVFLDVRVLLFTTLVCVGAGLLVGLAPARQALRVDVIASLGGGSGAGTPKRVRRRLRHGVVIPQLALAIALLVVAGIHVRSLVQTELSGFGYRLNDLVVLQVGFWTPQGYWSDKTAAGGAARAERGRLFFHEVLARTRAVPGVDGVSLSTNLPVYSRAGVRPRTYVSRDGFGAGARGVDVLGPGGAVSENYFHTMGIPLVAGRDFDNRDSPSSPHVAIISRTLAQRLWPGGDAMGQSMAMLPLESSAPPSNLSGATLDWLEVIGVVGDAESIAHEAAERPVVYYPLAQSDLHGFPRLTLEARGSIGPSALIPELRSALMATDAAAEVPSAQPMTEVVAGMLYPRRATAWIMGSCGVTGLILAVIGLYGVISYSVAQRQREIGIRSTLGADRHHLVALVMREGATVAAIGATLGVGLSLLALRLTSRFVSAAPTMDVATFVSVPIVLAVVILLACYIPARRASRVDPMGALRGL